MITVIGGLYIDLIAGIRELPIKPQTVYGKNFKQAFNGRGFNQAVLIRRLGGNVSLVSNIGKDIFGDQAFMHIKGEGVKTDKLVRDNVHHSGIRMGLIDDKGLSRFILIPGSNDFLSPRDILASRELICASKILLINLEMPLESVAAAAGIASSCPNVRVILNAAPAKRVSSGIFSKIHVLVTDTDQASAASGINVTNLASARSAGLKLLKSVKEAVIISLSNKGALLIKKDGKSKLFKIKKLKQVYLEKAFDHFMAALAFSLYQGKNIDDAVNIASKK